MNTESAKETFYKELIQNTNLLTNHNFTSIITKINKEIEHHTQQRYSITYISKGKGKLQTPAGFNSQLSISSGLRSSLPSLDFGISDPWEAAESEKKEEESEDQEFTYQHLITENPEVETPNIQTQQHLENPKIKTPNIRMLPNQRNQNSELINQQNLPPVIFINQLPINPIAEPIQQPLQLPPQQPGQQQLLQQPPQPPNLDPMAYTPIAKLDNFTGKEDDAQAITANGWNNARAMQAFPTFSKILPIHNFNAFKAEFLRYFSNNNSINHLVNEKLKQSPLTWDASIKTYAKFKQLTPTISQHHRYLISLSVVCTAASCNMYVCCIQSEANHTQAVNLVMNRLSELDSKLEKFSESINKRLEEYLADNHAIYHDNRKHVSATIVINKGISKLTFQTPNHYPNQATNLSTTSISTFDLSAAATSNISTTATNHLSTPTNSNTTPEPSLNNIRQPLIQSHSKLEIGDGCLPTDSQFAKPTIRITHPEFGYHLLVNPEDTTSNNTEFNQHIPTNTILLATISSDKCLAAIFPFKFKENTLILLFSRAALEEKPITAMYMDARVDGHPIKLILDSGSADSIITRQLMNQLAANTRIITADGTTKTSISEIDDFPIEINGIIVLIKSVMTGCPKPMPIKDTHEYQQCADEEHNKLSPILFWDDNNKGKRKQKEELTWETDDLTWTDNDESKLTSSWEWKEDKENKEKGKGKETTQTTTAYNTYTIPQ
ncbi:hypothetical protein G9A89_015780 [Geosiphon pyriformis]|nr:hypothetical protein G9A89_015780 [Geosiphon pyriformis]